MCDTVERSLEGSSVRESTNPAATAADVMKALGDPVRWDIVRQMAEVDELPCAVLETTLPISKPTISYHIKMLANAGLVHVRKTGRSYYYSLRREGIRGVREELWTLAPRHRPAHE